MRLKNASAPSGAALPSISQHHEDRMLQRMREMLESLNVSEDPRDLVREVAFFAERSDISEEVTRMDAHLVQFRELLTGHDPVGRTLDFLTPRNAPRDQHHWLQNPTG